MDVLAGKGNEMGEKFRNAVAKMNGLIVTRFCLILTQAGRIAGRAAGPDVVLRSQTRGRVPTARAAIRR